MWRSWGAFCADSARLTRLTQDEIRGLVRLDPPEQFRHIQERAKRRGALILTAHYGSFELLHAASSAYGQPITIVHRTMANRRVDAFLMDLRARMGTRSLARGYAARELLQALREGQVVAIPFDQAPRRINRVFAPFFGVDAATNSGLARLALAAGAPVFAVVLAREGDTLRHRMVVGPEIPLPRTGNRERDVELATHRFNAALEALVRERPEHWIWMYRRWKARPDELVSPYEPGAPPLEEYRRRTRERLEREEPASSTPT
jgi:KDO2-lipid IV(A) lauroyltransferase